MAKNCMAAVAELLGVEIGEPFYILQNGKHKCIHSDNDLYKITEEGLANINNTDGCYEYHGCWRVILTEWSAAPVSWFTAFCVGIIQSLSCRGSRNTVIHIM